jgi:hypothetical protein
LTIARFARGVLTVFFVCCTVSFGGEAATLIQYGADPAGYYGGPGLAVNWQQTSLASGVTISAVLGAYQPPTSSTVTAYLTTTLGPASTMADLISTSNVTVAPYAGTAFSYTLFSGLNLTPGNYFLTVSVPIWIGWLTSSTPSLFETPEFMYKGALSTNLARGSVNTYMPSSDFYPIVDSASPADYGLMFNVSDNAGPAIPEPGHLGLTALGIFVLWLAGSRQRHFRLRRVSHP